jgi:hypothetical protein
MYNVYATTTHVNQNMTAIHNSQISPYPNTTSPGMLLNTTLNGMCTDEIIATETLIFIGCPSKGMIVALRASDMLEIGRVSLPTGATFTSLSITKNIRSKYMTVISRINHNFLFYQVTNVTNF